MEAQNQNIVSEIMIKNEQILALQNELKLLILRFNENNVYNEVTDAALSAIPSLAHLTQSKVGNSIAAYIAIDGILDANSQQHRIALALTKG